MSCAQARLVLLPLFLVLVDDDDEVDLLLPSTLESHHRHLGDQGREALNQREQ